MTKKDFELIASAIAFSKLYNYSITKISYELAERLAQVNPRFNRERFLEACGVEIEKKLCCKCLDDGIKNYNTCIHDK